MFEIIYDPKVIDFLCKLEKPIKTRIFKKIEASKEDPHKYFERLTKRKDYKLRIGNYRVIADIDSTKKKIQITLIGHRKNIYN